MTDDALLPSLPALAVERYVMPLREGGSLPALVEGSDGRLHVAKWRGAGQGSAALVAEVIAGELARAFGLLVPRLARIELDPAIAKAEPDPEIRDLLLASVGPNLACGFLRGALTFDPAARLPVDRGLAAKIVLLDVFTLNVDRTCRNPNLLWFEGALWLIDHGAALYFQHAWDGGLESGARALPRLTEHALWAEAGAAEAFAEAGEALQALVTRPLLERIVALVPDEWLALPRELAGPAARRAAFVAFFERRAAALPALVEEVGRARSLRV